VKDRAERNKARSILEKDGTVRKGDGKDVDHKKAISKGGTTTKSNLQPVKASTNRSFSRNADGSMKSQTSKRERKK
jgi:ribosomal protein S5